MTDPQQPQDVVPQQQGQPPLIPQPSTPLTNTTGENLQCQWQGCGERCQTPEALYEHVCERHVGRKSTNNLNLTCQWGSCRTTTVKRDHITSHIRVHVPLKPHKCEFCGKSFKRPQDLKKHVKTHADDSVIMRSPEPNAASRQGGGGNMYTNADPKAQNFYTQAMNAGQAYDPNHPQNQYYQPQHPHQGSQHPSYGPVTYYSTPAPQASLNDYEVRKRGFEALDQFFGDLKRRQVDPANYQHISQRLYELQALQLPLITQPPATAIPAYQPVSALAGIGEYAQGDPMQAYSLPPMGNAKSRGDLTSIDQILEQMQATIYENDHSLSQAGIAQPGAQYVSYRTSQSPPGVQLPNSHVQQDVVAQHHQHHGSGASANDSASASTAAMTPPSSTQSYTSSRSPVSHHASTPLQGPSTGALYPTLLANTGMEYPNSSNASNAATLGSMYDGEDQRRRYAGGMLQRAQPVQRIKAGGMDFASEGSATPPTASKAKTKAKKSSAKEMVIDPALGGENTKSPTSDRSGEVSKEEAEKASIWVESMRLIEWLRDWVKQRLERGEYEPEVSDDTEMGDNDENKKHEGLYPVLKAVVADN